MKNKLVILLCLGTILLGGCAQSLEEPVATEAVEIDDEVVVDIDDEVTVEIDDEIGADIEAEVEIEDEAAEEMDDESAAEVTTEPAKESITPEAQNAADVAIDDSVYIGEYLDSDVNDPSLEIAKGDDGKYIVQIGIYRLTALSDGVGELTADGMLFTATDAAGNPISGIITVQDQTATVTFTDSTWEYLENGSAFQYSKSSDIPNIWN